MAAGRTHERTTTMTLFDRLNQGRSQGEPMRDPRAECVRQAYLGMADFYRPEAPDDGFGHVRVSSEEISDRDRLDQEARQYALAVLRQDESSRFRLSGGPYPTCRAAIWLLEACFLVCTGKSDAAAA